MHYRVQYCLTPNHSEPNPGSTWPVESENNTSFKMRDNRYIILHFHEHDFTYSLVCFSNTSLEMLLSVVSSCEYLIVYTFFPQSHSYTSHVWLLTFSLAPPASRALFRTWYYKMVSTKYSWKHLWKEYSAHGNSKMWYPDPGSESSIASLLRCHFLGRFIACYRLFSTNAYDWMNRVKSRWIGLL